MTNGHINYLKMESIGEEADFNPQDIDEWVQKDYIQGYIELKGPNYVPWNKRN